MSLVFVLAAGAATITTLLMTVVALPRLRFRGVGSADQRVIVGSRAIFCLATAAISALAAVEYHSDMARAMSLSMIALFVLQAVGAAVAAITFTRLSVKPVADGQTTIEALRQEAFLDPLTGLHNRRYLDERLLSTLRDRQLSNPLALMVIDIDDFKRINDAIGHQAGDRVLQSVSMAIASTLRSTDTVGRYGGDEFVSVLPGSDLELARELAERVRRQVSAIGGGSTVARPTVSIGVACFPDDGVTAAALLRAADVAMYQAKRDGRNRIAYAVTSPITQEHEILLGGVRGGSDLDHPLDTPSRSVGNR